MTQFQPGQVVYDKWGHRGEYVEAVSGGHHVKCEVGVGALDDEYVLIENYRWEDVYAKPPMPKVSLAVVAIVLVVVVGLWLA